jgi:hypothetical protein
MRERCGAGVAVLLVSDGRNGISADGRMVNRAVTFLVDLADEDAGKGERVYNQQVARLLGGLRIESYKSGGRRPLER